MSKEKLNQALIKEAKQRIDDFFSARESYSEAEINEFVTAGLELYDEATTAEKAVIDAYVTEKMKAWLKKFKH